MHPDLAKLVELQRADSALKLAQAALDEVPRRRAEQERRMTEERARLDTAKAALEQCQKARRQHEGELQTLQSKHARYQEQLMGVKTNKEYTAMLHEIEGVKREIVGCEDRILAELERAEGFTAEVRQEEQLFKQAEATHRQEAEVLDAELHTLQGRLAALQQERATAESALAAEPLGLFQRVARVRGVAVAEAKDGMCQQCHVKLRPQMYVDIKRNDQLVQCPSCSRLMFYEPPAPTVDAQV